MKTPNDNVFRLIKSMSAAEKRYFKRHYSSDKNLLSELFNFVNKMKFYDEQLVKAFFGNSKLSQNLKVYKAQLLDILLKSLASYHYKTNDESKIRQGLLEINILQQKGLYKLAFRKIKKIKQLCYQNEAFEDLILLLHAEEKINTKLGNLSDQFHCLEESRKVMDDQALILDYKILLGEINLTQQHRHIKKATPNEQSHYTLLLKNLIAQKPTSQLTQTQIYWNKLCGRLYFLIGQSDKAIQHLNAVVQLFDAIEKNSITKQLLHHLLNARFLLANIFVQKRNNAGLKEQIKFIHNLIQKHLALQPNLISLLYLSTLDFSNKKLVFVSTEEDKLNRHLARFKQEKHPYAILCRFQFISYYLLNGYAQKAQEHITAIKSLYPVSSYNKVVQVTVILELINHYETGDFFLIKNWIQSTRQKITQTDNLKAQPLFHEVFQLFEDLMKGAPQQQPFTISTFKKILTLYPNNELLAMLQDTPFVHWINAVEENVSLKTYFQHSITLS